MSSTKQVVTKNIGKIYFVPFLHIGIWRTYKERCDDALVTALATVTSIRLGEFSLAQMVACLPWSGDHDG